MKPEFAAHTFSFDPTPPLAPPPPPPVVVPTASPQTAAIMEPVDIPVATLAREEQPAIPRQPVLAAPQPTVTAAPAAAAAPAPAAEGDVDPHHLSKIIAGGAMAAIGLVSCTVGGMAGLLTGLVVTAAGSLAMCSAMKVPKQVALVTTGIVSLIGLFHGIQIGGQLTTGVMSGLLGGVSGAYLADQYHSGALGKYIGFLEKS